jgi:hypothetical protein
LTYFLLLFSAEKNALFLKKISRINELKEIANTYNSNYKSYFISNYYHQLIANLNLNNYFKT